GSDINLDFNNIMVVDDNKNNRRILKEILKIKNINTDLFDNAHDALKTLESGKKHYDILIIDYHMPDVDGLELIENIRNNSNIKKQPIIFLHSSSDEIFIKDKCEELNVNFKIVKPVVSSRLFNILSDLNSCHNKKTVDDKKSKKDTDKSNTNKKNILIVEDDKDNLALLKYRIKDYVKGCNIVETYSGEEALNRVNKERFGIIFMDIQMPGISGHKTVEKIRKIEKKEGYKTPIIATSAGVMKKQINECFESGMDDFISKPIDIKKLQNLLTKYDLL
ncbi:MAG: response regulator, partial [Candidatus Muiribacteriota bacterium]